MTTVTATVSGGRQVSALAVLSKHRNTGNELLDRFCCNLQDLWTSPDDPAPLPSYDRLPEIFGHLSAMLNSFSLPDPSIYPCEDELAVTWHTKSTTVSLRIDVESLDAYVMHILASPDMDQSQTTEDLKLNSNENWEKIFEIIHATLGH